MKMFDNSNTRIFLQGNEDVARWHLPVVLSKFKAFVRRCKEVGLKQDRFTMFFEDTGTSVFGQYFYGEESVQLYSPLRSVVIREESKDDLSDATGPKTFWVSTTQGYFWVEVRYAEDNSPIVILTPFVAISNDSFVYPGMELTSPGMISGCPDGSPASRYVLAQNGGVMSGEAEEKGTIISTAIIDSGARITVVENSTEVHDYLIVKTTLGQSSEIRRIFVSFSAESVIVDRQYASVFMASEGETNLSPANLMQNPTWVHRKCSGSYFSPNKTIGYHVDIGADDAFLGNMQSVTGGDLLDNSGGFGESLFNHTPDLYRIAEMLSFPVSVDGQNVTLLLVAPTMGVYGDKCWGGYGLTQSWAGCVDYQQDFSTWLTSPRFVLATVSLTSNTRSFVDPAIGGSAAVSLDVNSWDGKFRAKFTYEVEHTCGTDFYSEMETKPAGDQCAWSEGCTWTCDTNDPGSTGECPKGWTPYSHWEYFSRENLRISRRACFLFGEQSPSLQSPQNMNGFYFLFDGLWHLDIGVFWTSSRIEGNYCGLCAYPYGSQDPGENVVFSLQGVDPSWVSEHGHEYVENMEIITPLGYVAWPLGGTTFGFVAKVPEEFAAPHEPVMMKGGIEYTAENVEGEKVFCERALMTTPCICAGNNLSLDPYSAFILDQTNTVQIVNGCPPFEWFMQNAKANGKSYLLTEQRTFLVAVDDDCSASVHVKDACGTSVSLNDSYAISGVVTGDSVLEPGETGVYTHNLENATYTGTLEFVSGNGNSAILRMPEGAAVSENYTASWSGKCGSTASRLVSALPDCDLPYDHICTWNGYGYGECPAYYGATILLLNRYQGIHCVATVLGIDTAIRGTSACYSAAPGAWYCTSVEGAGSLMFECFEYFGSMSGHWHTITANPPCCGT